AVSRSATSFGDFVGWSAPPLSTAALCTVRKPSTRFLKSASVAAIRFVGCAAALARKSATYTADRTQRATQLHLFFIGASSRTLLDAQRAVGVQVCCRGARSPHLCASVGTQTAYDRG